MTVATSYSPSTFAEAVLAGLGAPDNPTEVHALEDWEAAEGGAGPQFGVADNDDNYNPMNTTLTEPGAVSTNSAGVKSYTSWTEGLDATISTLEEPAYADIVADLKSGASEQQVAADVGASPWGTPDWDPGGTPDVSPETGSSAELTGYNLNPLDLFGIPQTAASSLWSDVGPFLVKAILVIFGLGILIVGAVRISGAHPARDASELAAAGALA